MPIRRALFIILTYFLILILAENTLYPVIIALTGQGLNSIFSNEWSRLIVAWCLLIVLLIPTVFIIKKQFTFTAAISYFRTANLNTKITLMVTIVLVQAFLAGLLQMASIFEEYSVFPVAFNSDTLKKMIGIALITIPVISIFLIKRLFDLSQQEAITATQEAFLDSINDLFLTVKSQRHDFSNHIQVINGLLQLGKNEEALRYSLGLGQEVRETNEALKISNPIIAALVKAKYSIAISNRIRFRVNFSADITNLALKPYDLVCILGNLLDNAIFAASLGDDINRRVYFNAREQNGHIIFEVMNLGPVISPDNLPHIFDDGFTTKADGHSGTGLAIGKKLVSQYKGSITVESTYEKGTVFTVTLPHKK